jgi:hypothetical protein
MKNIAMKNILRISIFAASALVLSACALPHSQLDSGTTRPTLAIVGAAPDALVYVDGVLTGTAAQYDGKTHVLKIEEGMHSVSIVKSGNVLHEEKIYAAGGENKIVEVGGGQ